MTFPLYEILDHGYIEFIEPWGTGKAGAAEVEVAGYNIKADYECGIIEAARQSTQAAFRGWDEDKKLLERLYTHKHATPFEFAGMIIEVQAPIFVFREWHRHRTQSYNEMSARYAALPELLFMPDEDNLCTRMIEAQGTKNRQASATHVPDWFKAESGPETDAREWIWEVENYYARGEDIYRRALEIRGIPKELARITMPVGHYSRMRCSTNLRNWLAFLTLRMDPLAQYEIRMYAHAVAEIIGEVFPHTWELARKEFDIKDAKRAVDHEKIDALVKKLRNPSFESYEEQVAARLEATDLLEHLQKLVRS